ncbi:MAG: helix-turn-helix transcriptional regulator, partial [Defluviitaleaceae bacterium]|nr:helix-turn-helix transcriptional regulator [Defluviitaleaceae bacterium]
EEIEVARLSDKAYLSPFYYQRLFKRVTGWPVMEYVKLRRLTRAAELLNRTEIKISDIAHNLGFKNHETFTRAFKVNFGITPTLHREQKPPFIPFKAPVLSKQIHMKELYVPIVSDGIVFDIRLNGQVHPRHFNEETQYVANAVSELDSIYAPEGFSGWTMPVGDYIVCKVEGENLAFLLNNARGIIDHYVLGIWAHQNRADLSPESMAVVYGGAQNTVYMEIHYKINKLKGEPAMYVPKSETCLIVLEHPINVVGLGLANSGLPMSFEGIVKLWDKKEVYTEEIRNGTKNTVHPTIEFGISSHQSPYYLVGRAVAEYGEQDSRYSTFTIPARKYIKTAFNAETFGHMVENRLGEHHGVGRNWAEKNGFVIDDSFTAEVYPHETTMLQHPEMYLLFPVKG